MFSNAHSFYERLALMAIMQAVRDYRAGSGRAGAWLLGEGFTWLQMAGSNLEPGQWSRWLAAGCPGKNHHKPNFSRKGK